MDYGRMQAIKTFMILFGLLAIACLSSTAIAQDLDAIKAGVVKIRASSGQIGTGFIVRVEPDVVYIITAAHVIAGDLQPKISFFSRSPVAGKSALLRGSVLPGAQVADDLRGLAVIVVQGKENIPEYARALVFESSALLVSGGEEALVIGHPGGGGDWSVVKRDISNRVVHDITLDPGVASRFSGGPILVNAKVVGMVMSNRGEFGLGITHNNVLNYLEGIGIEPGSLIFRDDGGFQAYANKKKQEPEKYLPTTKTGNDEAPMVLVPAGEFLMGSQEGVGEPDEHPQHLVELDSFYLDTHEVTNQQFQKFVETTEYRTTAERKGSAYGYTMDDEWENISGANWRKPEGESSVFSSGRGTHPVVSVSWEDATAYCLWAGKRLPTEAEWEYAARGDMTSEYWWGTGGPGSRKVGNLADETVKQRFPHWVIMEEYDDSYLRTAPVGAFEANPWGLHDMAGNAWEWVADWYDAEYYGKPSGRNPQGPDTGDYRVFRGGSWSDKPQDLRSANREKGAATIRRATNGFRCAVNVS